MIHPVFVILHVAVEHGRVRLQPDLVGQPCRVEPLIAIDFVVTDDVANAVRKYFSPAPRQRIHSRRLQLFQGLANRELRPLRQIRHLDHGEGLEMNLRKALLQARTQIEKILKRQIRMQSANNVKLGNRLAISRGCSFESLLQRHRVGSGRIFLAAESAQPASGDANIRRIDMAIHVEICLIAMHALANRVGHPAYSKNVASPVEREGVLAVKALARLNLVMNRPQPRVVSLERMEPLRKRHPFDDIAGVEPRHVP